MTSTNASGLFGRVGEFNVARETFSAYVERIEMFFTANNIVEMTGEGSIAANQLVANWKPAIFVTEEGPEVYSTLSNLLASAKPKDLSFTDNVRILEKHYNPKPFANAQSFHFGTRHQKFEESVITTAEDLGVWDLVFPLDSTNLSEAEHAELFQLLEVKAVHGPCLWPIKESRENHNAIQLNLSTQLHATLPPQTML